MEHHKTIPQAPLTLTLLGTLPLLVLCLIPKSFHYNDFAFTIFIYGAMLLSFLAGINWGLSLWYEKKFYLWSALPVIFAWVLVFFYHLNERADNIFHYWIFLLAAFIVQFTVDYYIASQDERLSWVKIQRSIGTAITVLLLLIIIVRLAR